MMNSATIEQKFCTHPIHSDHVAAAYGATSGLAGCLTEAFRLVDIASAGNHACADTFKELADIRASLSGHTAQLNQAITRAETVVNESCTALLGLACIADQAGFDSLVSPGMVAQLIAPTIRDLMMVREMLQEAAR